MLCVLYVLQEPFWLALWSVIPIFFTYVLSYVFLGIYWNNHHRMHAADRINGKVLWANLHLLFWLSLIPFVTGWMGQNHFAAVPSAAYGIVMLFAGIAYYILAHTLLAAQGPTRDWRAPSATIARARCRCCFGRSRSGSRSSITGWQMPST